MKKGTRTASKRKQAHRRVASSHAARYIELPIDEVFEDLDNENDHPDDQIVLLRASVREFGQVEDVLIDRNHKLVAGNGLHRAMKLEGCQTISCKYTDLTGARRSAYRVGTNQLARLSSFNPDKLQLTASAISKEMGVSFDPSFIGFDRAEWEMILSGNDWHGKTIDPDRIPPYDEQSETVLIKIADVQARHKKKILGLVNVALEGTEYVARAY